MSTDAAASIPACNIVPNLKNVLAIYAEWFPTDDVRRILTESGYVNAALEAVDEPMEFGRDADAAYAFIASMGITRGLVHDLDDDQTERALADLRQLLDEHATADGVLLGSSAWLVTARVP